MFGGRASRVEDEQAALQASALKTAKQEWGRQQAEVRFPVIRILPYSIATHKNGRSTLFVQYYSLSSTPAPMAVSWECSLPTVMTVNDLIAHAEKTLTRMSTVSYNQAEKGMRRDIIMA